MIVLTRVVQQHLGCSDDEPAKSTTFLQRKRAVISGASRIYGCFRTDLHPCDIVNDIRLNFRVDS
jgi:hypothetical protein